MQNGNKVQVLDLGALTADTEVAGILKNDPKLELRQESTPQSGRCGTTAIYCHIYELLESKFGNVFTELPRSKTNAQSMLCQDVENLLKNFNPLQLQKTYRLTLDLGSRLRHADYHHNTGEVKVKG